MPREQSTQRGYRLRRKCEQTVSALFAVSAFSASSFLPRSSRQTPLHRQLHRLADWYPDGAARLVGPSVRAQDLVFLPAEIAQVFTRRPPVGRRRLQTRTRR